MQQPYKDYKITVLPITPKEETAAWMLIFVINTSWVHLQIPFPFPVSLGFIEWIDSFKIKHTHTGFSRLYPVTFEMWKLLYQQKTRAKGFFGNFIK